ncbi:MAG: sodium:solute symporter family protein [Sandaracinaceae bacterium]
MDRNLLAWCAFGLYVALTTALALRGMKKTTSFSGFALGNRDLGPTMVGITLAAAIASTATFVINPGFVFAHGVSALMHLGLAANLGVIVALVLLSKGFRQLGEKTAALTLPHWIGARYRHPGMRTYFALLNLVLAISFVVLIVKGSALVMQHTLGLGYVASVLLIVIFVFSYILMGGTYAHVYTNAFQGGLMILVALAIFASGFYLLEDGVGAFFDRIAAQDANLVAPVNPESSLFGSVWDVYVCGFVIGAGLMCQPHILTKSLYLKKESDLRRYLIVAVVVGVIFALVLMAGLYARVRFPDIASQDEVMPIYLTRAFSPLVGVLISVALLAAGMSTLDGLLVGASTIAANDVFLGKLGDRWLAGKTENERQTVALKASRWILVGMGVLSAGLALDPPELVGIFAQVGIYGLVSASLVPVAAGIFVEELDSRDVFAAALLGPAVHFTHYLVSVYGYGQFVNPASTATEGVLVSVALLTAATAFRRYRARNALVVGAR